MRNITPAEAKSRVMFYDNQMPCYQFTPTMVLCPIIANPNRLMTMT